MPKLLSKASRASDHAATVLGLAALFGYLAADLAQISLGLDALVYADLAQRLSDGQGHIWALEFFLADGGYFYDHPPLGIWLLSNWFAVLGDAFYVEKLFSLLMSVALAAVLAGFWHELAPKRATWLPLTLLFLMPVTTHALKNTTLDGLLAIIGLLGVWAAWRAQHKPTYLLVVGVACTVGLFVKGPFILFLLGAPACFAVLLRGNWRQAWLHSVMVGMIVLVLTGLVLLDADARHATQQYLHQQLLASLSGERPSEHGRLYLFGQLLWNLALPGLAICVGVYRTSVTALPRSFWCFVLLGLSAVLPLVLSPRLYRHYLLTGMPYFAIAAGLCLHIAWPSVRARWLWCAAAIVLFIATLRYATFFGRSGEHAGVLQEVAKIAAIAGSNAPPIHFCEPALRHQLYLARHYNLRSTRLLQRGQTLSVCAGQPAEGGQPMLEIEGQLTVWELPTRLSSPCKASTTALLRNSSRGNSK